MSNKNFNIKKDMKTKSEENHFKRMETVRNERETKITEKK